ncbi:FAD-binding protein [Streptomyces sp. NPDC058701]|uniref:FAD-binding oxidoreductase n=1 Tax=Streptomyces sp. NPDC058701 TaxID=3346608 RepID=UPI003666B7FF
MRNRPGNQPMCPPGAPVPGRTVPLSGWGRTAPTTALLAQADSDDGVRALLERPPERGVVARGAGRSYGDPAQNAGGAVVELSGLRRLHGIDTNGTVTVDGGLHLRTLTRRLLRHGFFLPVVPGTGHVTVGGAIAADVHGKNHPVAGSFGDHVVDMVVQTPRGRLFLTPDRRPEEFWATVGGMGLTGVITRATLRTERVPCPLLHQHERRYDDLDALLAAMAVPTPALPHVVAWIDGTARGARLGRSILTRAAWARPADLSAAPHRPRHAVAKDRTVPHRLLAPLLSPTAVRVYNQHRLRTARASALVGPETFFHPLDAIAGWNLLYGPRGLVQYQYAVPHSTEGRKVLIRTFERLQRVGCPPYLAVLKRLGRPARSYLSFPIDGWTLALDFPAAMPGLARELDALDGSVLEAGGRLYLAKDSRCAPEVFAGMYQGLEEWRAVRDGMDPGRVLCSDQARRLRLIDPRPGRGRT